MAAGLLPPLPATRTPAKLPLPEASLRPSPSHSQHPNQLNAQKQTGRASTYREKRRLPGSSQATAPTCCCCCGGILRWPWPARVPAPPSSAAANFSGSCCLKSSCPLCLVGAEPAKAAGKVTQEETYVLGGRSPPLNSFGAALLQDHEEPPLLHSLEAQTCCPSHPGPQLRHGRWPLCQRMEEKPCRRQRCCPRVPSRSRSTSSLRKTAAVMVSCPVPG